MTLKQAMKELRKALSELDKNNSIDVVSFSYGYLLGKGVGEEDACYGSDQVAEEL